MQGITAGLVHGVGAPATESEGPTSVVLIYPAEQSTRELWELSDPQSWNLMEADGPETARP